MQAARGIHFGKAWEEILEKRARSQGLLPIRHHVTGKMIGPGRVILTKSELDFSLYNRAGRVAIVDAKTFDAKTFGYNDLLQKKEPREHQIERARLYQEWGLVSGFLVWFRPLDRVAFFGGHLVAARRPGARFAPPDGVDLGRLAEFDLRRLLPIESD